MYNSPEVLDMLIGRFAGPLALRRTLAALALSWAAVTLQAATQTFTVLYTFDSVNFANGSQPIGDLVMDSNGVLYGVT
jgi:hypothetical protein